MHCPEEGATHDDQGSTAPIAVRVEYQPHTEKHEEEAEDLCWFSRHSRLFEATKGEHDALQRRHVTQRGHHTERDDQQRASGRRAACQVGDQDAHHRTKSEEHMPFRPLQKAEVTDDAERFRTGTRVAYHECAEERGEYEPQSPVSPIEPGQPQKHDGFGISIDHRVDEGPTRSIRTALSRHRPVEDVQ